MNRIFFRIGNNSTRKKHSAYFPVIFRIQSFIYNISSKGALKGLRSRSFYLELLLENLVDEILSSCFLYRTNLLYTGGGHAYLLLPNTQTAKDSAAEAVNNINKKLLELFGSRLFVAYGLQVLSQGTDE